MKSHTDLDSLWFVRGFSKLSSKRRLGEKVVEKLYLRQGEETP